MEIKKKITNFLGVLAPQKEAGLLIADQTDALTKAENILKKEGYEQAGKAQDAMTQLEQGKSLYCILSAPLAKDTYDFIIQYCDRGGMIQLMDRQSMELRSVQFDPRVSHLVLLTLKENLLKIEDQMPIRDKVGITEIL